MLRMKPGHETHCTRRVNAWFYHETHCMRRVNTWFYHESTLYETCHRLVLS
jgi:hypothetical protein